MTGTGKPQRPDGAESPRDSGQRHRRLGAVLRGACEDPDTLMTILGPERIAAMLALPESAIAGMAMGRPALRRRFGRHLRKRIGLTRLQVAAAKELPGDLRVLVYGIYLFATTIRLAGTPRILPRTRIRELAAEYGEEPLGFALAQRALLRDSAEALATVITGEPPSETDQRLFVRALAAHGHPGAACIALMLGLPVSLATRHVEDRFDAVITGLPTLAARALAHIRDNSAPVAAPAQAEPVPARSSENMQAMTPEEAAWHQDAAADAATQDDATDAGSAETGRDEDPGDDAHDRSVA